MSSRRDEGSGSVLLVVAMTVVVAVGASVLVVLGGVDARHRAQVSADLASIAAAAHAVEGSVMACSQAREVAAANGGLLRLCDVVDGVARVEVVVQSRITWLLDGFVGRSRAGPST